MASEEHKQLLIEVANRAPNPAAREEAAKRYRDIFNEDVPVFEGPVLEGEPRMGPASLAPDPVTAAAPTPEPAPGGKWSNRLEMLGDRMSNMVSLGTSRPIMDALGLGSGPARRKQLEEDPEASMQFEVGGEPVSGTALVGDTGGGLLGAAVGPARMLGEAALEGGKRVAQAAAPYVSRIPSALQGATSAIARMLLGAGTGVATNAAQNVGERGGDVPRSMDDMARLMNVAGEGAPTAAIMGGGGDLLSAFASRGQRSLRGTKENPTWIGRYAKAKERGSYKPDETIETSQGKMTVSKTREGSVAKMRDSQDAAETAIDRSAQADLDLTQESHALTEADWAPLLKDPVSRARLEANLLAQQNDNINPRTGEPYSGHLDRVLSAELKRVRATPGKPSGLVDPSGEPIASPPEDFTAGDVRRYRQEARKSSSKGKPTATPEQSDADVAYDVWRKALHDEIPGAQDIDARATARADEGRERRDLMFRSEENVAQEGRPASKPEELEETAAADAAEAADVGPGTPKGRPKIRPGKREAGSTFMGRYGDSRSEPGKRKRSGHERLREMDPEFEAAQDLVAAKRAEEATSMSLQNMVPNSLSSVGEAGFWGPMLRQQGRFIGGRLVDPAFGAAARNLPKTARLVPLLRNPIDALLAGKKEKEKEK